MEAASKESGAGSDERVSKDDLGRVLLVCLLLALIAGAAVRVMAADTFTYSPALPKFVQDLRGVGPAGIPVAVPDGVRKYKLAPSANHYTIDINEYQDTLHPSLPPTTLWGYNPRNALGVAGVPQQRHLGGIIVAERGVPVQITFRDNLPLAHILPVDTTLMGADGPQNRVVTHLHGGFVPWISDGGPYATWDPLGNHGVSFLNNQVLRPGQVVPANEAEFYYPNQQSARLMWYHDHAMGTTRLNAYAGIASAYIVRDMFERDVLVGLLGLPKFVENGGRELPIIFQDKIFKPAPDLNFPGSAKGKGSLWYPSIYDPARWDVGPTGTAPVPSCVPEFFGDTILVNGTAYPKTTVAPRRYRLRVLNACQARFLNLQLYEDDGTGHPNFAAPGPDWLVIGTEGGFLKQPVKVPSGVPLTVTVDATGSRSVDPANPGGSLITAPAERWDIVVDFHGKSGKKYLLCNDAPAPFPMGDAVNDYPNATSGGGDASVLMRFDVAADSKTLAPDAWNLITPSLPLAGLPLSGIDPPLAGPNPAAPAASLSWLTTPLAPLPIPTRHGITVRQLTLNEIFDQYGRLIQMLGTNVATSAGDFSRMFMDPVTETPKAGATEVWQIINTTGDVHPIHFHLINAQLLSRRPFDLNAYLATPSGGTGNLVYTGPARGPLPTELGWKETFKMNPGEVTTVIMKFSLPTTPFVVPQSPRTRGYEYVWHCHILEHEEHDMMRPLVVQP